MIYASKIDDQYYSVYTRGVLECLKLTKFIFQSQRGVAKAFPHSHHTRCHHCLAMHQEKCY